MTKKFLGAALTAFLLNPTGETQGNGSTAGAAAAKAKPAAPNVGLSAVDLVAEIERNPEAFDTSTAEEDDDGEGETGATAAQAKAAAEAKAKAEQDAATKAKAEADAKAKAEQEAAAAGTEIQLTADQKAWLELRTAAKTPEEAAEIDKQAPAFTDAEWAAAEKTFNASPAAGSNPPTEEVTAQLTAAQAEATQFKTEVETLTKRLDEAQAELARAKANPTPVAKVHPLFLEDATGLEKAEAEAYALKKWAAEHWDGSEAIAASGDQPAVPAYTAAQVRKAAAAADETLNRIIPAAREKLAAHISANAGARQVYPELFNPQATPLREGHASPFQARETILRQLPGLRTALPHVNTVLGDAFVGEQLRELITASAPTAEAKALAAALVKAVPALARFMPALTAPGTAPARPGLKLTAKPVVPLARPGSAGGRSVPRPALAKSSTTPSVTKFVTQRTENGGDELTALTESLRGVNVG